MKRINRDMFAELKKLNSQLEDVLMNKCTQDLEQFYIELGESMYNKVKTVSMDMLNSTRMFKNIDDFYDEEKIKKLEESITAFNDVQSNALESINSEETIEKSFDIVNSQIEDFLKEMHFLVHIAVANNEHKLAMQLKGMIRAVFSKICTFLNMMKFETLKEYVSWSKDITQKVAEDVGRVRELYEEKLDIDEVEINKNEGKPEISKIYESKKLNRLLLENGFESIRQNGSHKIFHKDGFSIPVPQHSKDLGKGLSIAIQKQALQNTID